VFLDPGIESGSGETYDMQWWIVDARSPGLFADGQPDFEGCLGRELMKTQGGQQADHTLWRPFAGFGQ